MTPEEAKAKADRFPAELRPHPGYVYEGPREVEWDGVPCIEIDAGIMDLAQYGKPKK